MDLEWHSFAMVLSIPHGRESDWESLLRTASPPTGIQCTRRSATLLLFCVEAEMEFLAIEKAETWLHSLAARATPPFPIGLNPQPTHEIDA